MSGKIVKENIETVAMIHFAWDTRKGVSFSNPKHLHKIRANYTEAA